MVATATQIPALEGFDEFVQSSMAEWKTPGTSVVIVKDGEVLLSEGYGLRDVEQNLPVTPQTLFAIGSCSKAFTATALAMMVDEGKLDWDTPVREYLPDFRLHDETATAQVTAFDLVTHRTGMARHEFMWYGSPLSRREIYARLRYLEPSKRIREMFQYSNLMYMTAGILLEELSGMSWEDFIRERIFSPLGMTGSNTSVEDSQHAPDFSLPYDEREGEVRAVPFYTQNAIGPAGSINSSVHDLTPWLLFQLNKGKHGDTQLVSEAQIAKIHAPQIVTPEPPEYAEMPMSCYGFGWGVRVYRGHLTRQHAGGIDGFISVVGFIPEENLGVAVLTNNGSSLVAPLITNNVFDRLLGLEPVPWGERLQEAAAKMKEMMAQMGSAAGESVPNAPPSHSLDAYVGVYQHPGYGEAVISQDGDALAVTHNGATWPLRHVHYDIFEWDFTRFGVKFRVTFHTNVKGEIESVEAPLEATVAPIVFTRVPESST